MSYVDWFNSIQGTGLSLAEQNRQNAEKAAQQRAAQQPATQQGDFWSDAAKNLESVIKWDVGGWRPVEHTLNILGSLGTGVMNALEGGEQGRQAKQYTSAQRANMHFDYGTNKWVQNSEADNDYWATWLRGWRSKLDPVVNFATGFGAAVTNNTSDPNYRTGSDVIETYTDFANRENNPTGYVDTENNADPTAKFWGGLAMDVALDPLWLVPGGAVASGVRGAARGGAAALKGVKAAETLSGTAKAVANVPLKTIKGVVVGAGADAGYKVGRHSNRLKPAGLKQYAVVEDYKAFEKAGRRANVGSEDLLKLAKGEISAAELSAKLTSTAGGAAKKGTKSAAKSTSKYSEEALTKLGLRVQNYVDNAETVIKGVWRGANDQTFWHAGADAPPVRPETQMNAGAFQDAKTAQGGTPTPASQTSERVVDRVDTPDMVREAPYDDGVLPTAVSEHNTVALPDHEMFGIRPGMSMAEAKINARRLLYAAAPGAATANPEIFRNLLEAYGRVFTPPRQQVARSGQRSLPAAKETVAVVKKNPTVYTPVLSDAIESSIRVSDNADSLAALKELNATEFADDFETIIAQRAQIMDDVIATIGGKEKLAEFRVVLNLSADEGVSEFIFGMNRFIDDMKTGNFDGVFEAIQLIAKLPFEIPGYTDRARKLVQSVMDANTLETESRLISDMAKEYRTSLLKVGADLPEDAALQGLQGDRKAVEKYALDPEYNDAISGLDEIITPLNKSLEPTNPGDYVNVFGKIIEFPEWELKAAIDDTIDIAMKKADGESPKINGLSAQEFESLSRHTPSANNAGYSRGDSLRHRKRVQIQSTAKSVVKETAKKDDLDKALLSPRVPQSLDTVYDHVVGFAREPLGLEDWVRTIFAISRTTATVAPRAAALIKKLDLENLDSLKPVIKYYRDTYLKAFQLAEKAQKQVKQSGGETTLVADRTAGVDFEGNIFVDTDLPIEKPLSPRSKMQKKLSDQADIAAKDAESAQGAEQIFAKARVRETVGRREDVVISNKANATRQKLEKAFKKTDPKTGDPIHARHTDGDWLNSETLMSHFLKGSVAAYSLNLVEHAKLAGGNGVRRALESLAPMAVWSDRKFSKARAEAPTRKPLFDTPEQVVEAIKAFKQYEVFFNEALTKAISDMKAKYPKSSPENILKKAQAIMRRGDNAPESTASGNLPAGKTGLLKDDPYAGFSKEEAFDFKNFGAVTTPHHNMVDIGGAIDSIAARAGVTEYNRADIWEAIVRTLRVARDGEGNWKVISPKGEDLVQEFTKLRTITGYKPAHEVRLKDSNVAKLLKAAGKSVAEINKAVGIDTSSLHTITELLNGKTVEGLTTKLSAMEEPDVGKLIDLVKGATVKVGEGGHVTALSVGELRELQPELLHLLQQALEGGIRDAEEVGRMASGSSLVDFYRSKSPYFEGAMTESRAARIRAAEAINSVNLWNGDTIRELAKTIDPQKILATNTRDLAGVWARITKDSHKTVLNHAASAGYRAHIGAVSNKVFRQEGSQAAWEAIAKTVDESNLFVPGSIEAWNAKLLAMRKTRLLLGQSGIYDVTAGGRWGGHMRAQNGLDPDYAYIGAVDVLDGLEKVLPKDATRVIFDALKIDGKALPVSVVQETALLAMKMAAQGMDVTGRVASIENVLLALIKKTPKLRPYYADAVANSDGAARAAVAMVANALSDNRVMTMLMDRHKRRGAMAVATAEKNSIQIAAPILKALTDVADNMFITSSGISERLNSSVDDLRKALASAGYAKGSLEHIISSKMLESRSLDLFSPMEHTEARVQSRMKIVTALPASERQAAINMERAEMFRSLNETINEAAEESVIRSIGDAGNDPIALEKALDDAEHIADAAVAGTVRVADAIINGIRVFKTQPDVSHAGLQHAMINDELNSFYDEYAKILRQNAKTPEEEVRILSDPNYGGIAELKAVSEKIELQKIEEAKAWDFYRNLKYGTPAPHPQSTLQPAEMSVDEAGQAVAKADDSAVPKTEVNLGSMTSAGLGHKIHSVFSGRAGAEDLNPIVGTERMVLENATNTTMKNIEAAAKTASKEGFSNNRIADLIGEVISRTPEQLKMLESITSPSEFMFIQKIVEAAGEILHGTAISRLGLDTNYLNRYLMPGKNGPLPANLHGESAIAAYKSFLQKMLKASTKTDPAPKHDWVSLLKWVNEATGKAMLMPTIGADFSARFGNRAYRSANGIMTEAEAKANGWVKIIPHKNDELSQFVDPDQYYPADMVTQLANTQKLLTAVMKTSNNKFIRGMDKTHNFVKSSLTLWVPANHEVNIQGEFMSNALAGVWSPLTYAKAYRGLKDAGYLKNVVKHNYEQTRGTFLGDVSKTFENVDAGSGVKLRVGTNRSMSFKNFMTFLNQNGIVIMNNTVEDLIVETGRSVNKASKLSKLTSPIWKTNQAIGHFAARRDNLFRVAHAIHIAEKQSFRNMDDLADAIRREVSAYHPTMHHLSAVEQKYFRRILFFYTWQRGMLTKVLEALIERPQAVVLPAKFNYAMSGAMGGDPQSFGHPAPNDPRVPGWAAGQVTGPMYYNSSGEVVSFSLNAPSLDILQKYFGGFQANPNLSPGENLANSFKNVLQDDITDQFSPTAATSFELLKAIDSTPGMYQGPDWPQFLTDMTGFGKISRMTGMTLANKYGIGPLNSTGTPMPIRSDMSTQQEMDYTRFKSFVNYITPLRYNFPSQYAKSAERERTAYNKKIAKYQDPNNPDFWDQLWGRISGIQK